MGALWDPNGVLHDPLYDRTLAGHEIAALTRGQIARNPELTWTLLGWSHHADVVVLEWQNNFKVNGRPFEWRGVDKMRLRNGRIIEETVYMDTAPFRAARAGNPHEPVVRLPPARPAKPN